MHMQKSLTHRVIRGVVVIVAVDEDLLLSFLHQLIIHLLLSPLDVDLTTLPLRSRLPVGAGEEALPLAPPAPLALVPILTVGAGGPEALRGQAVFVLVGEHLHHAVVEELPLLIIIDHPLLDVDISYSAIINFAQATSHRSINCEVEISPQASSPWSKARTPGCFAAVVITE